MSCKYTESAIFTNMCMVENAEGRILVQDRLNPNWPGITFPGGHVEAGEAFADSVIREVREETGLTVEKPRLCGIKHFLTADDGAHYIVLFYKANRFSGTLRASEEGRVFWIAKDDLHDYRLADGFADMFRIFEDDSLSEIYYYQDNGVLKQKML